MRRGSRCADATVRRLLDEELADVTWTHEVTAKGHLKVKFVNQVGRSCLLVIPSKEGDVRTLRNNQALLRRNLLA